MARSGPSLHRHVHVHVLLVLLFASMCTPQLEELSVAIEVVHLVRALGVEVAKTWKALAQEGSEMGLDVPSTNNKEDRLLEHIQKLGQQVDDAARRSEGAVTSLLAAQRSLPSLLRYELRLDGLSELAHHVDSLYRTMSQYTNAAARHTLEKHTLEDFAHTAVSHGHGSVRRLLDQMHTALLGRSAGATSGTARNLDRGVLALMKQAIEVRIVDTVTISGYLTTDSSRCVF